MPPVDGFFLVQASVDNETIRYDLRPVEEEPVLSPHKDQVPASTITP
jgi:predicted transcriptional regulator